MMNTERNDLNLHLYWGNSAKTNADIRANALFIYGKMVEAGVSIEEAKNAVERLFADGRDQGVLDEAYNSTVFE